LLVLVALTLVLPSSPVDPWNLFSPKKIATMIFALASIQVMGSVIGHFLGVKTGSILTGFLGGLISSTATTASLARQSKLSTTDTGRVESIIFLSATGAMHFEGALMLLVGASEIHPSLFILFLGPMFATTVMITLQTRKLTDQSSAIEQGTFKILPILKLSAFIISILILSKLLQKFFGQNGLLVLTFLVSLFEIHGSVIANIQLHDAGAFDVQMLGVLLTLSIVASYVSKLGLIYILGRSELKTRVLKRTAILFLSLGASWGVFYFLNSGA
jgi:uncharacterized membrane protein (DUF4010 family)